MSKDILKEYFSQQKSLDSQPREGFKEELIERLNRRIYRLECRRRFYSALLAVSLVALCAVVVIYYVPLSAISMPAINLSPTYLLAMLLLLTAILVTSHIICTKEMRELKRRLSEME